MKTTALTLSALAVLMGLAACSKENFNSSSSDPQDGNAVKVTLSANQDSDVTRAAIGDTGSDNKTAVLWSENDKLSVFDGADTNKEFSITSGVGETSGTFEGEVSKTSDSYVALYPYQSAASINEDRNTISGVTLSSAQTATAGTFDPTAALMTAVEGTEGTLAFKNAVGYIKVTPTFACTKITLTSNNSSDALAGTVSISIADGTPTASIASDASDASDASNSVSISGDIAANSTYYIAVLPKKLTGGFKLVLTDSEGSEVTKTSTKTLEIKRNTITDLGSIEKTVTDSTPYVTFSAESAQTFKMTLNGEVANTFEYSVGDGAWGSLTFGTGVTFGGSNGDLRLRGKNSSGTAVVTGAYINAYATISFTDNNVKVKGSGDIRTLVDWENYSNVSTENARFCYLFKGCTALTSAPELPAETLANQCYYYMFNGCTALTSAPVLPAKTLADDCYCSMFDGCTSLETAPKLPAETLADGCYYYMFKGCTALKTAPKLPATTLAENCYSGMFYECTALQSDIELPAETLVSSCYSEMFYGCTSLTKIILRATSREEEDYPLEYWLESTVTDEKTRTIYTNLSLTENTDYPYGWTVKGLSE